MQTSPIGSREFYAINAPEAYLHEEVNNYGLTAGRVVLGETAQIKFFGRFCHSIFGSIDWFHVKTPDGRQGYVTEQVIARRSDPYVTDLEVTKLKTTIYIKIQEDDKPDFYKPDILVHAGTRLHFSGKIDVLSEKIPFPSGTRRIQKEYYWTLVSLPDGRQRYIKNTKITFDSAKN